MLINNVLQFPGKRLDQGDGRRLWSVCPHLSHPASLFDYYVASGSIMLILGKCLCYDCYELILGKKDLKEFMESCEHMTDGEFQKKFIDPLLQFNGEIMRARRSYTEDKKTRWTWISCYHVSGEKQIESLYTSCNPIFFHEGFVNCNDCIKVIPSANSYTQTLLGCEAMMDDQLQNRVIDRLYPINRKVFQPAGHCRR